MKNKHAKLPVIIFAVFLILFMSWNTVSAYSTDAETQGSILYVKPGADGTCTSWADACELQTALFNAVDADQIWVAAGTYKPTTSSDRTKTFQLKSGVEIYGGFPSTGGTWEQRNWETNLTTLSGDIGVVGNAGDNSFHVVTGSNVDTTAMLDGFVITGGNSNGHGGGMYNESGNATLNNLTFSANSASSDGGGISNWFSSPTLTNVTFNSNTASSGGGGMQNYESSPTLTNVTFSSNTASIGGGLINNDSDPTLIDVTFSFNTASSGGGMYNAISSPTISVITFNNNSAANGAGMYNSSSNPVMKKVTFSDNEAFSESYSFGGGMYNEHSNPILTDVSFIGNSATVTTEGYSGWGGGMCNQSSNPTLTNVLFASNFVVGYKDYDLGGGIHNQYSSPKLTNVTFSNNSALFFGGGMSNELSSNPTLINVTFNGNRAPLGGGISNYDSSPTLKNSILWGNTPEQIYSSSGLITITNSIIQGGYPGTGNIDAAPLLGPLTFNGGFSQTHALGAGSPAIDKGDTTTCPQFDQRAYARPTDGDDDETPICDMGAYEYDSYPVTFSLVVDNVGNGSVVKNPNKTEYQFGDIVTLTATVDSDWVFTGWSGDASGTENPLTLTMYESKNINATFKFDAWTITTSILPADTGVVTLSPDQAIYHYGDEVALTALPIPGFSFAGWSGDSSGTENPLSLTMDENYEVTANFTQDEYSLTISVDPADKGSVTISPIKPFYHYGDEVTLTATGVTGWWLEKWSGEISGNINPITFKVIGNTDIVANFTDRFQIFLPLILR